MCTVYLFLYSITALAPYMCNYRSAVFFPDLRLRDPDQMSLIKALRGFPQGARTWGKSTAAAGQTSLGKLWANNPLENKYHFIPTQCNWPPHIRSTIDPNGSINSYINSISFPRSFSLKLVKCRQSQLLPDSAAYHLLRFCTYSSLVQTPTKFHSSSPTHLWEALQHL